MLPFHPRALHCQLSSTKGSHHVPLVAHGPGCLSAGLSGPGTRSAVSEELRCGWRDEDVFSVSPRAPPPHYSVLIAVGEIVPEARASHVIARSNPIEQSSLRA